MFCTYVYAIIIIIYSLYILLLMNNFVCSVLFRSYQLLTTKPRTHLQFALYTLHQFSAPHDNWFTTSQLWMGTMLLSHPGPYCSLNSLVAVYIRSKILATIHIPEKEGSKCLRCKQTFFEWMKKGSTVYMNGLFCYRTFSSQFLRAHFLCFLMDKLTLYSH
jgi:hypothetical protein